MNKAKDKHSTHDQSAKHDHEPTQPRVDGDAALAVPPAEPGAADTRPGSGNATGLHPKLEEELACLQDKILRLQADYDNFRKRVLREKSEIQDNANRELVAELLPILDHLHLGLQAAEAHAADQAFRDGLRLIQEQLTAVLSRFGLLPVDLENKAFDPNLAEALNMLPSATVPEGTVLTQVRRGYLLKNRLLRPAQVIVSSGATDAAPSGATEAPEAPIL